MPLFFMPKGRNQYEQIAVHHHISMLTKKGQQHNQFYQELLGLRRT